MDQLLIHLRQLKREGCLQGFSWDRLVWSSRLVIPLKTQTHIPIYWLIYFAVGLEDGTLQA